MNPHLINGDFQSDKYPTTPLGKVPLSTKDPMAQDLLAEYARRRRAVDPEFADAVETAIANHGFKPVDADAALVVARRLVEKTDRHYSLLAMTNQEEVVLMARALLSKIG